jgi:hypothetical protein
MFLQQGGIPGFGGAMPENVQLPPEMETSSQGWEPNHRTLTPHLLYSID